MPPSAAPSIARLDVGELEAAAALLARAFRDNPLNAAVIRGGERRRLRANQHGMRAMLPMALRHAEVWTVRSGDSLCGALLAVPPHSHPLPPPPLASRLRCLLGQGLGVSLRWAGVFEALEPLHPPEAHWYLGTLGVAPAAQRQGFGAALLRSWLARVDSVAGRVYLETDRAANLGFYQREGFAVVREIALAGVPVWCMSRPVHGARPG